jgi:hypothetical protein
LPPRRDEFPPSAWLVRQDGFFLKEFAMSLHLPTRHRHRTRTFRPLFEALEDRRVLNGTTTFAGGVLTIVGDNSPNTIVINDNGANVPTFGTDPATSNPVTTPPAPNSTPDLGTTPALSVVCNGATQTFPAPAAPGALTRVLITLGNKKSRVTYNLTAGLRQNAVRDITVNLGMKGNDTFALNLNETATLRPGADPKMPDAYAIQGGLNRGSRLNLTVNSGKGNEKISVNGILDPLVGSLVGTNASATFNLNGGKGDDDISTNLSGVLGPSSFFTPAGTLIPATPGMVILNMDGGSGNDNVFGLLHLRGGMTVASVRAGRGTKTLGPEEAFDDANVLLNEPPADRNPTHFTGMITGSGAKSTCFHTANVTVKRCKHDIVV